MWILLGSGIVLYVLYKVILSRRYRRAFRSWLHRDLWFWIRSLLYIGNRFTCPCCEGRFRKFLSFGVVSRPNAVCPRCNSKSRHRLLWSYLKNKTNLFCENLKVLHFAPEYQFSQVFSLLPNLHYITADLQSNRVKINLDITSLPLQDETFDVILCNHVLEHILDDEKAMLEMFRVLKPGGWAILQVPMDRDKTKTFEDDNIVSSMGRERWFKQKDHVRIYGCDYSERLKKAGFGRRQLAANEP